MNKKFKLECLICFDAYDNSDKKPTIITSCGHTFCATCLKSLITCPTCRQPFKVTVPNWEIINIINDQHEQPCYKIDDTIQPKQSIKAITINNIDTTSNNMIQLIAINEIDTTPVLVDTAPLLVDSTPTAPPQEFVTSYSEMLMIRQEEVMNFLLVAIENNQLNENLRTYSLYNNETYFCFGITFQTENIAISDPFYKLPYPLIDIEPQSPANEAGMRNGQRLVAVNGLFLNKDLKTLNDVVITIEESYLNRKMVVLTVLESDFWDNLMKNSNLASKSVINSSKNETNDIKFKRCKVQLEYDYNGYGFYISPKIEPKFMLNKVEPESPAYKANLRNTDVIVEIDGKNIRQMSFDKLKQIIEETKNKGFVEVLAISLIGYTYYKEKKKKFSDKNLVSKENTEYFSAV